MADAHAQGAGVGRDPRTDTHWAAILAESQRIDGKPTQRHIAYLGGITESAIELPAQRAFFWKEVKQQLDELEVSKDDRARIEAAVEAKVPRLSRREYNKPDLERAGVFTPSWRRLLAAERSDRRPSCTFNQALTEPEPIF